MATLTPGNIRNIAVVGHGSCGKTTLVEGLLFLAGATRRLGKVDDGNSTLDFDPEEVSRKISINSAVAPLSIDSTKVNLIDTPGYADFVGEVYAAANAVDAALIVVDSVSGVQVQTVKAWEIFAERPKAVFINRLDRENADFDGTLSSTREFFPDARLAPLHIPIGIQSGLRGTVDVLRQRAFLASGDKPQETEIPQELAEMVATYREELTEAAAEGDDALLERYLEEGVLTDDELVAGMKTGFATGAVVPVFCGSGATFAGLQVLLESFGSLFPSPIDRGALTGTNPRTGDEETREPDPAGPLCAYVFKTMTDPYVGRLNYVRVFSGTLSADSQIYNASNDRRERVGHLYVTRGKEQEEVKSVVTGDIATIPKLTETSSGDTLTDEQAPIRIAGLAPPEPVFSVAVAPLSKGDEEKLSTSLAKLSEEDPTVTVRRNSETRQTIVSGLGDLHLEILMERLKRKFGVEATLAEPRVPYRETIKVGSKAQGKYKKQSGGRGQYGDVWLELQPVERGTGFEFVDQIVGGVVPRNYIPSVEKGVRESMESGIVAGYPVVDIRVILYDGSHHTVDSSDMAFKIAGSMGFKSAATSAKPTLLEPIVKVEVVVPEKYMGDVMGQLSGKRGKILGMDAKGKYQIVRALVPLSEVTRYATELRSITHGEGSFTMEASHYDEVPHELQQRIIDEAAALRENADS